MGIFNSLVNSVKNFFEEPNQTPQSRPEPLKGHVSKQAAPSKARVELTPSKINSLKNQTERTSPSKQAPAKASFTIPINVVMNAPLKNNPAPEQKPTQPQARNPKSVDPKKSKPENR